MPPTPAIASIRTAFSSQLTAMKVHRPCAAFTRAATYFNVINKIRIHTYRPVSPFLSYFFFFAAFLLLFFAPAFLGIFFTAFFATFLGEDFLAIFFTAFFATFLGAAF